MRTVFIIGFLIEGFAVLVWVVISLVRAIIRAARAARAARDTRDTRDTRR